MAIIGAVVGGGAIVGIAVTPSCDDHSDYSNYHNYSNYSDAAERAKRRREAKMAEIQNQIKSVNDYKTDNINPYLSHEDLIRAKGTDVSLGAVKENGDDTIEDERKNKLDSKTAAMREEIVEIDRAIQMIDHALAEAKEKTQ